VANTWSEPVITRVRVKLHAPTPPVQAAGYERWVAVFGAGYSTQGDPNGASYINNNTTGANGARKGKAIYIVDIATGKVLAKKAFVHGTAANTTEKQAMVELRYAFASAPAVFDTDFDGFADVIYIGDLGGNLWKWVVRAQGFDPNAGGTLASYDATDLGGTGLNAVDQPNWPFRLFFRGSASTEPPNEISGASGGAWDSNVHYQSFFFPPTGVLRQGKLVLAWGAGERASALGVPADIDSPACGATGGDCTDNNHFYVVKDDDPLERVGTLPARIGDTYTESNLLDPDATTPPSCATLNAARGYMLTAREGEKFVSNSTIFLGTLFTGSFLANPSANNCASKGTSYLYAFDLDCATGEFPGPGDSADDRRMAIGSGLPTRPRVSVGDLNQGGGGGCPSPPCCINKVVVVTSDGEIYNDCPDDLPTSGVKVRSWRER
jgi:Tfp pilus tip-associated adhesin PilY1